MKQKIEIPKGLRKVECIISEHEEYERRAGRKVPEWRKKYCPERFTVGKIYTCKIDKTGKALILKTDNGQIQRASYKYFKPSEIIKRKPKSFKKRIASKLIKILKRF